MRASCLLLVLSLGLFDTPSTLAGAIRSLGRSLPGDAGVAAAAKDQTTPALCQGGSSVLVLWSDSRANSVGGDIGETSWDIYGMRIDGEGSPLDALPQAIVARAGAQKNPRCAWNGTSWLVVFESMDFGGTGYYEESLEAVRLSPAGQVLEAAPIKLYNMTPVGATWAVASDGSGWVVVNQSTSVSGDLVAARVSGTGDLLDPGPVSLVPATYYSRGTLRLAYAGGVFLLAYEESMTGYDPTNAIRFDAGLELLDAAPFPFAPAPLADLISSGSAFYAVWNEQLPDYTMGVKGTRIATTGQKLDGSGVLVSGNQAVAAYTTTSAVWDGSLWKVIWGAASGARIARVSTTGQVLDPNGVAVAGPQTGPASSAGNGSVQLAWSEYTSGNTDVWSAHIDAANAADANRALSLAAPAQLRVDIATSGGGSLMAYRSSTATGQRVLARALDAAGNPIGAEPVELDAAQSTSYPGWPAVAWNGSVYLVAWNNASGVVFRRLQLDGTPLDAEPVLVMNPGFGSVDVEALGSDFLVVGLRCGFNCQYIFPIATRVRGTDGSVQDTPPIAMGGTYSSNPRLAVLGGRWLLVWRANVTHDECMAYTMGTFIDSAGVKVPDFNVHGPYSTCGGNGIFTIGLASSGEVALMLQSQELTSGWETDLLFRRIHPNGAVDPPVNLTPWKDDQYRPQVAWDGERFIAVWQDQKTDLGGYWSLEQIDARSDLIAARISAAGTILDPQGFVVSNGPTGEAYPSVAAAAGTTLIAGSVVRNDSSLASYRIAYDLFDGAANAWPVAVAAADPTEGDVPLSVDFSSAGSTDLDGAISTYAWDFGDGAISTEAAPTHQYTLGGPHVATLMVTDDGGAATTQQILVEAVEPNVPPVAVVSADKTSGTPPFDVTLYATGSYDPDGFVGNIEWSFSDGGSYWGSPAYHTFYEQGTHVVTLTVHDARGGTGSDTLVVTAGTPDPPAAPTGLTAIAFTEEWINLTWSDGSNNEVGFAVERCAGGAVYCNAHPSQFVEIATTGANIDYYGDTGLPWTTLFTYRVRAFNGAGNSAYSNAAAAETLSPQPVAILVPSVLNGPAPLSVQLDASGSYDPDGTIVAWSWVFGDGGSASGPVVQHTFQSTAFALLTVTSNNGAQGSADVTITVSDGSGAEPLAGEAAGNGTMLVLGKVPGGVQLTWGGSCLPTDTDYGVYEGPLGEFDLHAPVLCSTGGATATTLVPPQNDVYYLIVPNTGVYEGRYGASSGGAEIPAGPTRCYPPAATRGCF